MYLMNKLDQIINILDYKSSRIRESYFQNNYIDVYNDIQNYCIDIYDLPFNQKIWHYVNNQPNYHLCKCGNKTSFYKNWLEGYRKCCSAKCAQNDVDVKEKRKKSVIEKYGVENVAQSNDIKKKIENTNLKKYGTKSSFQNEEVRKKWKNNIKEKYGVDHTFQLESVKEKSKKTNLDKYGREHFVQTDEYIEKSKKTNNEKYGYDWFSQSDMYIDEVVKTNNEKYGTDYYTQSDEYKERVKKSNLDKYGYEWYYQSDDFKKKSKITNIDRYGEEHYSKSIEYREYTKSDKFKNLRLNERIKFYFDRGFEFISSEKIGHVKLKNIICGHEFDIHPTNLQRRMLYNITVCTVCNPINSHQSGQELNVIDWIKTLNIDVITQTKEIINPYELDMFIPTKNIAIEYNGLYWHSEIYKDNNYHLNKMLRCDEKNIDLIQIWEDDWIYRQDIIKSIIKNRLGLVENKIYARKCYISEIVDRQTVVDFFNKNHIQGITSYKIAVGLFYNDNLVSCMLFHKPKKEIELVRFANLINCVVIGSASRLFKYYMNKYVPDFVVSFADRSIFNGGLYKELGFNFEHRTDPNYWWVIGDIRRHKFNYTKAKLVKSGFDPDLSESKIMRNEGHFKIFGVGLDKYIWKN